VAACVPHIRLAAQLNFGVSQTSATQLQRRLVSARCHDAGNNPQENAVRSIPRLISLLFHRLTARQREIPGRSNQDVELSVDSMMRALFTDASTDVRVRLLTLMVLDLFVEVEALRTAVSGKSSRIVPGIDPSLAAGKSPYQTAYLNTVYLTHNSAGPSSGVEKLLARFYPSSREMAAGSLRESSVLRDLGFSEDEVARYINAARKAETFT
jgi:hypothetical protein